MELVLLHTADMHGRLDEAALERLVSLRADASLYFDCGDAVKSGNVGVPVSRDSVWTRLARAKCDAGVPGNREFHVSSVAFRRKLRGCLHPLLAANMEWNGRPRKPLLPLAPGALLRGTQPPLASAITLGEVGVFGVMVPMVTERMAARAVSAFLHHDPIQTARECVEWLRPRCKVLVALTHIGLRSDKRLAEEVPGVDIILGGHSHDLLDEPLRVGSTWLAHIGAHAYFAGVHEFKGGRLTTRLEPLRSREA